MKSRSCDVFPETGENPVRRVTQDLIQQGRSDAGGWSRAQMALIGVAWPPVSGWRLMAVDRAISDDDARKFVALKDRKACVFGVRR
jgi:hypothetical protein